MRKAIVWILIAMLTLSSIGFAEGIVTQKASFNSHDAVRTSTDLYLAVTAPDSGEMLVRVPLSGDEAVCVDRAERFEDLVAYSGGAAYLAVEGSDTEAKYCIGNRAETLYNFGSGDISSLAVYGDELLVLNEGLLFSFNPNTQVCLKLSGAQMLDYVLDQDCAYYISESDKMEYTAQLGNGESASTQAGCIYRLDLASGETTLLLKSGGTDLQLGGENVYFHNLADAYAVRASETETQLCGRLYSLNTSLKTLNKECADPDSGYWIVGEKPVALYNSALNLMDAGGARQLYKPENGSLTVSDGERLYVWEPSVHKLTEVQPSGLTTLLYGQDLSQALDADTLVDLQTANEALLQSQTPEANEMLIPEGETAPEETAASGDWFDQFIGNAQEVGALDDSAETEIPGPTPIPSEAELKAQQAALIAESTDEEDLTDAAPNVQPAVPVPIAITNDAVKMREGPGSEYAEIASIPAGVSVAYLGEAKSSKLSTWYQVQYKGDVGFIYSKYADLSIGVPTDSGAASADSFADEETFVDDEIAVEDPFEAALYGSESAAESAPKSSGSTKYSTYKISGSYAKIKNGSVNMRTKPGTAFSVITSIPVGTTVTFKGLGAKNSDGSKWYQVQYKGKTGWISQSYATITGSKGSGETSTAGSTYPLNGKYVYTEGTVNVRKGPSLSHGVIASVPAGTYLTFAKKGSTDSRGVRWYKVTNNGKTGWVSSRYCVIKNSKSGKTGKYVKTTASVNLRKGPGLKYGTIAALTSGTKLTYMGSSKTDSRGVRWYKVSYNGKACWISSRYSTLIS